MFEDSIRETQRQLTVCNACRYCEGFCSVFPAIQRHRDFAISDITHIANLCHNCRACHYACQYSEPHEFNINIPQALSKVRTESWERHSKPQFVARAIQQKGLFVALGLLAAFTLFFLLIDRQPATNEAGFYAYLSHFAMVTLFTPALLIPVFIVVLALRSYWREINGEEIRAGHIKQAIRQAVSLKNLAGGQGQGCNYEKADQYTNARRYLHQTTVLGFLLCFASTTCGTLMHYLLNLQAPYSWYALPKLLGVPGGMLLTVGCAGLAMLKLKADRTLSATQVWGAEMAFVILLGLTGLTGLILYGLTGTIYVSTALAVHLACVLVLFLLLPYSKMIHGFFRMAALIREVQLISTENPR